MYEKLDLVKIMSKISVFVKVTSCTGISERYFCKSSQKAAVCNRSVKTCSIVSPSQSQKVASVVYIREKRQILSLTGSHLCAILKGNSLILFGIYT